MQIFDGRSMPLETNGAGQYVIHLMDRRPSETDSEPPQYEVMASSSESSGQPEPVKPDDEVVMHDYMSECNDDPEQPTEDVAQDSQAADPLMSVPPLDCWSQEDSGCNRIPWLSHTGPAWSKVKRRVVIDAITKRVLASHDFPVSTNQKQTIVDLPKHSGHVMTKFYHCDANCDSESPKSEGQSWMPTLHQARKLRSDMRKCTEVLEARVKTKTMVQEVFSPPRFTPLV